VNPRLSSSPRNPVGPRAPRWLSRLALPAGLFFFLGGTTPGSVGSCDDTDNFADFTEFCVTAGQIECNRLRMLASQQPPAVPRCAEVGSGTRCFDEAFCNNIIAECQQQAAGGWAALSPLCVPPPTVTLASNCIAALQFTSLETPESNIPQCQPNNLCSN